MPGLRRPSRERSKPVTELDGKIREILAVRGPLTTGQVLAAMNEEGIAVTAEQLIALLKTGSAAGAIEVVQGVRTATFPVGYPRWQIASGQAPGVLAWGKPPQAESYEQWASYQADSAPPGTYTPNMPDDWKRRWKAKMLGQRSGDLRVEVRKSTGVRHAGSVQVLVVAHENGDVLMSMNGQAGFTAETFAELHQAVEEARTAMRNWRKAHPREETVAI